MDQVNRVSKFVSFILLPVSDGFRGVEFRPITDGVVGSHICRSNRHHRFFRSLVSDYLCRIFRPMPIVTRNILYRRPVDFTTELPPERIPPALTGLFTDLIPSGLPYPFLSPRPGPQDRPSRQPLSRSNRPRELLLERTMSRKLVRETLSLHPAGSIPTCS